MLFKVCNGFLFLRLIVIIFERCIVGPYFIFPCTLLKILLFHSVGTQLSIPYLLHDVLIQSFRLSMMLAVDFYRKMLLFSLHLVSSVNNFLTFLFFMICKLLVITCWSPVTMPLQAKSWWKNRNEKIFIIFLNVFWKLYQTNTQNGKDI